ncbi:hypothetical protein CCR75_002379 [Bremia lactucae]|uniref:Uncharacterized protein n=1 Tax=Bremia lactucae TaxID=4779 RepID=A0A976IF95_BRELC|nr:hypothetical protein CCR75_002379 [Bremia lactucae]
MRSRRGTGHRPRGHGDGATARELVGQLERRAVQGDSDRGSSRQALHDSELSITAAHTSPAPQCCATGDTTSDATE